MNPKSNIKHFGIWGNTDKEKFWNLLKKACQAFAMCQGFGNVFKFRKWGWDWNGDQTAYWTGLDPTRPVVQLFKVLLSYYIFFGGLF